MAKKTVKKSRTPKREFNKGKYKSKAGPGAGIAAGNIILLAIFVVLAYLIVVGPFQRGLFFSEELLPVHILSFSLLILWCASKLLRGEGALLKAPLDYCVFALVVFYFFSFFVAVNKSAALGEFLKVANYLVIYLLVFDLCRSDPFAFLISKNRKEAGKATIKFAKSDVSGNKCGEPDVLVRPVNLTGWISQMSLVKQVSLASQKSLADLVRPLGPVNLVVSMMNRAPIKDLQRVWVWARVY